MPSPSNEGLVDLKLRTTDRKPFLESEATLKPVELLPTNREQERDSKRFSLTSSVPVRLNAFPQVKQVNLIIKTKRFKEAETGFFNLTSATLPPGDPLPMEVILFRKPDQWQAAFVAYNDLPDIFSPLKDVLKRSPNLKVKGGSKLGLFIEEAYDNVTDPKTKLAKLGLLNLFAKMSSMIEPVEESGNWFSYVDKILEIAQSRVIALVNPQMEGIVRTILADNNKFDEYKRSRHDNHHKNMPDEFGVKVTKMCSIKSKDEDGNLQLTLGPGKDTNGNPVLVLDADIDESGDLLKHIGDVFRHKISGKQTHPFDIHEFLKLLLPKTPLGYELTEA